MKFIITVLIFISLLSCGNKVKKQDKLFTDCTNKSEGGITRCENSEVICYIFIDYRKGGLSCYFKGKYN